MNQSAAFTREIDQEPALAAAVGVLGGVLFSTMMAILAHGSATAADPGVILLHATSAILGGVTHALLKQASGPLLALRPD